MSYLDGFFLVTTMFPEPHSPKRFIRTTLHFSGGQKGTLGDLLCDPESWYNPTVPEDTNTTEKVPGSEKSTTRPTTMYNNSTSLLNEWDSDYMELVRRS